MLCQVLVQTRSFRMTIEQIPNVKALAPVADLLNDRGTPVVASQIESESGDLLITTSAEVEEGQELSYAYADHVCRQSSRVVYGFEADWQWPCAVVWNLPGPLLHLLPRNMVVAARWGVATPRLCSELVEHRSAEQQRCGDDRTGA